MTGRRWTAGTGRDQVEARAMATVLSVPCLGRDLAQSATAPFSKEMPRLTGWEHYTASVGHRCPSRCDLSETKLFAVVGAGHPFVDSLSGAPPANCVPVLICSTALAAWPYSPGHVHQ